MGSKPISSSRPQTQLMSPRSLLDLWSWLSIAIVWGGRHFLPKLPLVIAHPCNREETRTAWELLRERLCQQYTISDIGKEAEPMLCWAWSAPTPRYPAESTIFILWDLPQSLQHFISIKGCAKFPLCFLKPSTAWPPPLSRSFTLQYHLWEPQSCHTD